MKHNASCLGSHASAACVQQVTQADSGFDTCPEVRRHHLQFHVVHGTQTKPTPFTFFYGTQITSELLRLSIYGSGADIWDVVHREVPPRHCPVGCHCLHCKDKDAWLDVAESLKLTDEQKCKAMLSRYIASLLAC